MDDSLHFSTPNEARNRFQEIITFVSGFSFNATIWRQGRHYVGLIIDVGLILILEKGYAMTAIIFDPG